MLREIVESLASSDPDFDHRLLGFDDLSFSEVMDDSENPTDPVDHWKDMPEFEQPDAEAFKTLLVHFPDQAAIDAFVELTGIKTAATNRFIWFPEQDDDEVKDRVAYKSDLEEPDEDA
jgi:hypothetical protein